MYFSFQLVKRVGKLSFLLFTITAFVRNLALLTIIWLLMIGCNTKPAPANPVKSSSGFSVFSENDSLSVEGILICAHCYALNQENTGVDHDLPENGHVKECAGQCADLGYPIAILSEKPVAGTNVWVIRTSSQLFSDYMGKPTVVKGSLVTTGVIEPSSILVAIAPGKKHILL